MAGWLVRGGFKLLFNGFGRNFNDSGSWMPGVMWQPVAESCGPFVYLTQTLQPAGFLDGLVAGWRAGWMAGLDGGHHSCDSTRLTPTRGGVFV